jgi:putative nucleotidyltransferase with HDIG domain
MSEDALEQDRFFEKLDAIEDLPTLPSIAMEINRMLLDYDASAQDVGQLIEKDQALVPKILKLANSAFFGLRSKVNTLSQALVVLGFNTVRNVVVSVSIIDTFRHIKDLPDFNISSLWQHSVAVAVVSKHLAQRTRLTDAENAFTAGLLHDIGKVILLQYYPDAFSQIWHRSRQTQTSFHACEQDVLPANHAHIGGYLAQKWNIPDALSGAICCHHEPGAAAVDPHLTFILHAANTIVHHNANGSNENPKFGLFPSAAVLMEKELDTLEEWFPQVAEHIEAACAFFLKG